MKKKIAALAISLLAASSAMANIVTNGSFENLTGFPLGSGSWGLSSTLFGWTQRNNDSFEIQVARDFQTPATVNNSFNTSYDGAHYLELNANKLGDISQTLNTVADQLYRLSFGYSGRSDSGDWKDSLMDVYWGGVKVNPSFIDLAPTSGWQTFSYVLKAIHRSMTGRH